MTYAQIVLAALQRGTRFSLDFPKTHQVYYRRVAHRDGQLALHAVRINPAFNARSDDADASDGRVNLRALPYGLASIAALRVGDPGTSRYQRGRRVAVVQPGDPRAALPPRLYFEGEELVAVGDDLEGVATVSVFYTPLPHRAGEDAEGGIDGEQEPFIPEPFHELLVIEVARTAGLALAQEGDASVAALLAALDAEEKTMLTDFDRFVATGAGITASRFTRVPGYLAVLPTAGGDA